MTGGVVRGFRILGGLLVLALIVWCALALTSGTGWRPDPEVLGLGNAFEGTDQLPKATILAAVDDARGRMLALNGQGRWFSLAGEICLWLSFACTAGVTLIAGWFGRSAPAGGVAPDTSGLPTGATRAVGLLAGLAAVLTAGGSLAANHSHDRYDSATKAQAIINQSTKDLQGARDATTAQAVLDNLALKIGQL
jgi:hypothetical protein